MIKNKFTFQNYYIIFIGGTNNGIIKIMKYEYNFMEFHSAYWVRNNHIVWSQDNLEQEPTQKLKEFCNKLVDKFANNKAFL